MAEGLPQAKAIDARLEAIVNKMFQRCLDDGQYRQAMGLSLETRRMDIFEASITQSDDISSMLIYAFQVNTNYLSATSVITMTLKNLSGGTHPT